MNAVGSLNLVIANVWFPSAIVYVVVSSSHHDKRLLSRESVLRCPNLKSSHVLSNDYNCNDIY